MEKFAPTEIVTDNNSKISTIFSAPGDVSLLIPSGKTLDNVTITYGEPEIDARKDQAQLMACISLDDSSTTGSPTELVDVDVNMSAPINLLTSSGTTDNSNVQENTSSEKKSIGSFIFRFILIVGIFLFLVRRWNIKRRRARRNRQMRRRRFNNYGSD